MNPSTSVRSTDPSRYAALRAKKRNLEEFLKPDQTTIIEIVLRRIVYEGVFRPAQKPYGHM